MSNTSLRLVKNFTSGGQNEIRRLNMPVVRCPECGKVISTRFPIHDCNPFTEVEFESLVDKASQPLEPERKPDAKEVGTSESPTSGDCSESHTHSGRSGDI